MPSAGVLTTGGRVLGLGGGGLQVMCPTKLLGRPLGGVHKAFSRNRSPFSSVVNGYVNSHLFSMPFATSRLFSHVGVLSVLGGAGMSHVTGEAGCPLHSHFPLREKSQI